MSLEPNESRRAKLVIGTLKSVATVAVMSYMAANWLSAVSLDQGELGRLASRAGAGVPDPTMTGSIAGRTAGVQLDPCSTPSRR